jgi:hypothetical protein
MEKALYFHWPTMRHPHLDSSSLTSLSSSHTRSVATSTGHLVYRFQEGCQILFKGWGLAGLCAAEEEIPSDYERILSGNMTVLYFTECLFAVLGYRICFYLYGRWERCWGCYSRTWSCRIWSQGPQTSCWMDKGNMLRFSWMYFLPYLLCAQVMHLSWTDLL